MAEPVHLKEIVDRLRLAIRETQDRLNEIEIASADLSRALSPEPVVAGPAKPAPAVAAWKALQAQGIFRASGNKPGLVGYLFPGQGSQFAQHMAALGNPKVSGTDAPQEDANPAAIAASWDAAFGTPAGRA